MKETLDQDVCLYNYLRFQLINTFTVNWFSMGKCIGRCQKIVDKL